MHGMGKLSNEKGKETVGMWWEGKFKQAIQ